MKKDHSKTKLIRVPQTFDIFGLLTTIILQGLRVRREEMGHVEVGGMVGGR